MLFSYPSEQGFNDFYDSVKSIPDNFEGGEGFGKQVAHPGNKGIRKNISVESVGAMEQNGYIPKSQSSQSFGDHGHHKFHQNFGGSAIRFGYGTHPSLLSMHSTSSLSQAHIFSSMPSMNASISGNNHTKGSKGKLNSGKKKNNGEIDFRTKYKTEVCKYWAEYGYCEFGDQCAFAHGQAEIRQKYHVSNNYKTKKCVQYHEQGYCPYGVFNIQNKPNKLRKDRATNPNIDSKSYDQDMETVEIWHSHDPNCVCCKRTTRPRLPTFEKFSSEKLSEIDQIKESPPKEAEKKLNESFDEAENSNVQNKELVVRRYSMSSDSDDSH